jgi:hypothetical protein
VRNGQYGHGYDALHPWQLSITMATTLSASALLAALALSFPADAENTAECGVSGSAATLADVDRARHACNVARQRFHHLFGVAAPTALIVLHEEPGYEVALAGHTGVVFWPNSIALAARPGAEAHWAEVLPHEIMHALAMAHFYADADVTSHGGYGTPLPDWFEEGVAIWAEPLESQHGRLRQARRLPPEQRELDAILEGVHPTAGNALLMAPVPGTRTPTDAALQAFYPQAIAVVAFVHQLGGAPAMLDLGNRLRANPSATDPLLGLSGLPATREALLEDWDRWMQNVPDR